MLLSLGSKQNMVKMQRLILSRREWRNSRRLSKKRGAKLSIVQKADEKAGSDKVEQQCGRLDATNVQDHRDDNAKATINETWSYRHKSSEL